jgi:FixJ family two-component response regulator
VNQIYANASLSGRETEVLRLLGDGKTTLEIPAKLKISIKTVQAYCGRLKKNWTQPTSTGSYESRFCGVRALLKSS